MFIMRNRFEIKKFEKEFIVKIFKMINNDIIFNVNY